MLLVLRGTEIDVGVVRIEKVRRSLAVLANLFVSPPLLFLALLVLLSEVFLNADRLREHGWALGLLNFVRLDIDARGFDAPWQQPLVETLAQGAHGDLCDVYVDIVELADERLVL